jgi:hypothetical protein
MIFADVSFEQKITEANTVIVSRPPSGNMENPLIFRNGSSAIISEFSKIDFENWSKNPTLTFIKPSKTYQTEEVEDIFVSPVKSSIKVRMKVRISGKASPIPINSEDIVYLDE